MCLLLRESEIDERHAGVLLGPLAEDGDLAHGWDRVGHLEDRGDAPGGCCLRGVGEVFLLGKTRVA